MTLLSSKTPSFQNTRNGINMNKFTKKQQMAYVMGILACDGSFSGDGKKPRLSVKKKNGYDLLCACQDIFGGRIHGPYSHKGKDGKIRKYEVWSLDGKELIEAVPVILLNLPMSQKRADMSEWVVKYPCVTTYNKKVVV